jgi:hypothetical protein
MSSHYVKATDLDKDELDKLHQAAKKLLDEIIAEENKSIWDVMWTSVKSLIIPIPETVENIDVKKNQ